MTYLTPVSSDLPVDLQVRALETGASEIELYLGCGTGYEMEVAFRRDQKEGSLERKLYVGLELNEDIVEKGISDLIETHTDEFPFRERILVMNYDVLHLDRKGSLRKTLEDNKQRLSEVCIYFPLNSLMESLQNNGRIYDILEETLPRGATVEILTETDLGDYIDGYLEERNFSESHQTRGYGVDYFGTQISSDMIQTMQRDQARLKKRVDEQLQEVREALEDSPDKEAIIETARESIESESVYDPNALDDLLSGLTIIRFQRT